MLQGGLHNHQIGHTIILNQQGHILTTFALAQAPLDFSIWSYSTTQPTKNQNKTRKHIHLEATKATKKKNRSPVVHSSLHRPLAMQKLQLPELLWLHETRPPVDDLRFCVQEFCCSQNLQEMVQTDITVSWTNGFVLIYIYIDICVRKTFYLSIL